MPHFNEALTLLRDRATSQYGKGRSFERLMQTALSKEPDIWRHRFAQVWLWDEWPQRDGPDTGIDLIGEERDGGLCAIQCKFFEPLRPVPKSAIDSFLAKSEPARYTSRLIINTGGPIQGNTLKTLQASPKVPRILQPEELDHWDVDWTAFVDAPASLVFPPREPYTPHPYQQEAIDAVCEGFDTHNQGQLILPCGTGKTAVTLWIAERLVGLGGRVLYLVPSIALMAQTMREWSAQQRVPLRFLGICSDTRVARVDEDASLMELDWPVTTDLNRIQAALQEPQTERMTVVFCTYQSLPRVAQAQAGGAPPFDLTVCDEAHRTTGVEDTAGNPQTSPFRLVHDADRVRTHRRLYTTATPRIYTSAAQSRAAARQDMEVFSMDDESVYGPIFHRMEFSEAISGGWLTDYRVIILTLNPGKVSVGLEHLLAREQESGLNLDDAVKLLGCWDALADPEGVLANQSVTGDQHNPLLRAIAFTNTIKVSKLVQTHWGKVVDIVRQKAEAGQSPHLLPLEVRHVDGTQNSLDRQQKLAWLQTADTEGEPTCRILSNARCLTEGVDVPALNAVVFLAPRKSQVDVVQAVGRVMRRAEGKQMGYIILPVVVSPDEDPARVLDDNQTFQVVWSVLRALRSHDDRFDLEINSLDLNRRVSERIKIVSGDDVEMLEEEGLENETRDLEPFYASVRKRAQALDNAQARQRVLLELYERFFTVALRKDAERLGVVYTPVEVVDFILQSADHALQQHFGRRLTSENVHILDPFTGTGTFIVRLLQSPELIRDADLIRKFTAELHANEIVLLAYYIAAINIEEAYHGRRGMESEYAPFEGIVFTDTFNLGEGQGRFPASLPVNSQRAQRQQDQDITVIVGNPPYSAGQRKATDQNPNVSYPALQERARQTYAARSTTPSKISLYDSYKLALRWASDRIKEAGVIAFVTNGSFIDSNTDAGLRACLADEFTHLYVLNLRGNARTIKEKNRQEGGLIFDGSGGSAGSKATVAILLLVRDLSRIGPCEIRYKDIGDYVSRTDKLQSLKTFESMGGIPDYQVIDPDGHNDWINQRDPAYQRFMPIAIKEAKQQRYKDTIFPLSSYGIVTHRDVWVYSFDRSLLVHRMQDMIAYYEQRRMQVSQGELTLAQAIRNDDPDRLRWDKGLETRLQRNQAIQFFPDTMRMGMYRPFVKQFLCFDRQLVWSAYQLPAMFPTPSAPNQVIGVTGRGAGGGFSTLMTDAIPDHNLLEAGAQCFSRWRYEIHDPDRADAWAQTEEAGLDTVPGYRRVDNITDWCQQQFRTQYPALQITKDDIWSYLYGLLHAPDYRERYKADLSKDLPRIPFAPDFGAFRDAGDTLAQLHLGYETCPEYELPVEVSSVGPGAYQLSDKKMSWGGTRKEPDRTVLHVTPAVTLRGIPEAAHAYVVNGRTPLEWAVERLRIRRDKESGIVNDPNAWFADHPAGLVSHLRRLVQVSVETTRIVAGLPPALKD